MKVALFSDVHANRPAQEAVLHHMRAHCASVPAYHLGDLVGYAPWPNEVVEMIASAGIAGVAGNYDSTVATDYRHCGCRYEDALQEALSHLSYAWTLEHVTAATKALLGALPFRIDLRPAGGHTAGPTVVLVHGNHVLNTVYTTEERTDEVLDRMSASVGARTGDVVCFGHTHRPWHRVVGVHFVNTASVGRPKDGDPRAGYVVLDIKASRVDVQFVRVEYDVEAAIAGMADSTLPAEFGDYLRTGGRA